MCDVRRTAARVVLLGLAAGLLATIATGAKAQVATKEQIKRRQEAHARRETNATRQARIQRTIDETYSRRWEIAGGGGYLRFRDGESLKADNQVTWAVSTNYFLDPKLFIIADARGSFGNANAFTDAQNSGVYHPQINEYFFTGGAGYRFYRREKVAISVQATGGTAWGIFSGGAGGLNASQTGTWADGFAPAFTAGVNLDYNVYPNLAVRFAPTYVGTMFNQSIQNGTSSQLSANVGSRSLQNNAGLNIGIVYRFGKQ
jgi:hypothetical protein